MARLGRPPKRAAEKTAVVEPAASSDGAYPALVQNLADHIPEHNSEEMSSETGGKDSTDLLVENQIINEQEQAGNVNSSPPDGRAATDEEAALFLNASRSIKPRRSARDQGDAPGSSTTKPMPTKPKSNSKGKLPKVKRGAAKTSLTPHPRQSRSGDIYDLDEAQRKTSSPLRGTAEESSNKAEMAYRPKEKSGPTSSAGELAQTATQTRKSGRKGRAVGARPEQHDDGKEVHRKRGRPPSKKTVAQTRDAVPDRDAHVATTSANIENTPKNHEKESPSKRRKVSDVDIPPRSSQQNKGVIRNAAPVPDRENILQLEDEEHGLDRFYGCEHLLRKAFALVDRIGLQTLNGVQTAHSLDFKTKMGRVLERRCRKNIDLWRRLRDSNEEEEKAELWETISTEINELTIALEGSFNNDSVMSKRRAFGQDIYARVFPSLTGLMQEVCVYFLKEAKSIGPDENITFEGVAVIGEMIVMLTQLIGSAKKEGFLPDTDIPLIKPVGQILARLREVGIIYNRLESKHNDEQSQRQRSAMLHAQRREKDAQQKDAEKVEMRNNLLLRLRTARLAVEPDFRMHENLRSRPMSPNDELDIDANGEAFERIGVFGRRGWSTNPRLYGGKWSEIQQQALLEGLEQFSDFDVLPKFQAIFVKYCKPPGVLREFSADEIIHMASYLRELLLQYDTQEGTEPEEWILNIPVLK